MNRKVSVAPMMDCTDRHERYFLRLISKNTLLYTEMVVDEAINRGDKKRLLEFNINEKPVALQLGGSSPKLLAEASKLGEDFGYDEINLNLGCPSRKVEKSKFGACLMKEPNLVADCLSKMQASTNLPVTIKTRIGYDNVEDYENLHNFISTLKSTGVKTFIIHARKAMLGKFTPKQNLNIPPLKYEYVYKLKEDFPNEEVIINGGITAVDQIKPHLQKTDGVMIGRAAYHTPYMLAEIEKEIFGTEEVPSRQDVIEQLIPYVKDELKKGTRLNQIMRHTIGLFHGQTGASYWKRYLSENMCVRDADVKKYYHSNIHRHYNRPENFWISYIESWTWLNTKA
ncbi:tRNA dihydrouridine(20/20a) synthase DusA [Candidatus Pelagibacter sp.]|nr:tRNA dihydrouridine(20/20a) synthase DusA [Candidatus Pelagibacter sp.]